LDRDFAWRFGTLADVGIRALWALFGAIEAQDMDANPARAQGQSPFRAVLVPHRSLPQAGFLLLMGALAVVSFAAGVVFWSMGAWPVTGFFGLDLLIIYVAFKLNYRSGRQFETVEVDPDEVVVTRVHPSGRREEFRFATLWVRVELSEETDGRTELRLRHHARQLRFARFLNDDERRDFAEALAQALAAARNPVFG
jgi:uncharacterized membrane protein